MSRTSSLASTDTPARRSNVVVVVVTAMLLVAGLSLGLGLSQTAPATAQQAGQVVTINPGDNAARLARIHPEGTSFRFAPGVHRNVRIRPRSGQTFTADSLGSATLDGGGTTNVAFRSRSFRKSDTFSFNVTIENLVFTGYSPQDFWGLIDASSDDYQRHGPEWNTPTNWTMRNLRFENNPGSGDSAAIAVGSGSRVVNVDIRNHPGVGVFGHGTDILVANNTIRNTSDEANVFWHSGGIKLVVTHRARIIDNTITGSKGPGVWIDINSDEVLIGRNTIRNNDLSGVFYEVSRRGRIFRNTIEGNGFGDTRGWMFPAGIVMSSSHNSLVWRNDVKDNAGGITVIDQRTLRRQDRHVAPLFGELFEATNGNRSPWRGAYVGVRNNTITGGGPHGVSAAGGESVNSTVYDTTVFANNTYSGGSVSYRWGSGDNYADGFTRQQWLAQNPND